MINKIIIILINQPDYCIDRIVQKTIINEFQEVQKFEKLI